MATRIPSLRHHKPSGQGVVTLNSRDHYCGPWGSKKAKVEYQRLVRAAATHLPADRAQPPVPWTQTRGAVTATAGKSSPQPYTAERLCTRRCDPTAHADMA